MSPAAFLAGLATKGFTVTLDGETLVVRPASKLDEKTLELLREHKPAIIEHLSRTLPRLPWQLERLLSAAASGVLRCELRGVQDVSCYTLAWGCSYLTGDRNEALRRLWELYEAWKKSVN